jgi:hypothetical protein
MRRKKTRTGSQMRNESEDQCCFCDQIATKRIFFPVTLYLCEQCSDEFMNTLREAGMEVVHCPTGLSVHQKKKRIIRGLSERCREIRTWLARNEQDYESARKIGMIEGYASWEAYEHYTKDIRESEGKLVVIDASLDEILDGLKRHNLPNTPMGRTELYLRWDRQVSKRIQK